MIARENNDPQTLGSTLSGEVVHAPTLEDKPPLLPSHNGTAPLGEPTRVGGVHQLIRGNVRQRELGFLLLLMVSSRQILNHMLSPLEGVSKEALQKRQNQVRHHRKKAQAHSEEKRRKKEKRKKWLGRWSRVKKSTSNESKKKWRCTYLIIVLILEHVLNLRGLRNLHGGGSLHPNCGRRLLVLRDLQGTIVENLIRSKIGRSMASS